MRPALVATDLDGTFLGAEGKPIESNLAAARQLIEAGIEFVVATGRPRRWLSLLDPLRDLDPMVITSNGAAIGRLCAAAPEVVHVITPEQATSLAAQLPAELEPQFAVEYLAGWGREAGYPFDKDRGQGPIETLPQLLARGPVIKLMLHSRRAATEVLAEQVAATGTELSCTYSWAAEHGTVELSAPGVSKGTALAELLAQRSIDPLRCAAFGDMPNDLEMLQLVGMPFAMGNAHPSMFEHGFTKIGNHQDGAVGKQLLDFLG